MPAPNQLDPLPELPAPVEGQRLRPHRLYEKLTALFSEVNALAIRLKQGVARQAEHKGLPTGGHAVMQILHRSGPGTVPHLARLRCTSRQNIQIVVNRLVRQGYLEFATNEAHRRSPLVLLTEAGSAALAKANVQQQYSLEHLLPHLSEADLTSTTLVLKTLGKLLREKDRATRLHPTQNTPKEPRPAPGARSGRTAEHSSVQRAEAATVPDEPGPDDDGLPVSLL